MAVFTAQQQTDNDNDMAMVTTCLASGDHGGAVLAAQSAMERAASAGAVDNKGAFFKALSMHQRTIRHAR